MTTLYLNLKGEYFDQIKLGTKLYEFRLFNDYWKKRLLDGSTFKSWEKIIIRRGYPKANDLSKQLIRKWQGVTVQTITHPHFGEKPIKVFAIKVN